jgi:nitric oxide reductase NorQ protein
LIGPKGSGKTSTAYDLAKATKRNFFPINCGAIFKPKQTLVGTVQAKDGSTFLIDSEFMKHYTSTEPTLIFLDEISRIPQRAANYFMTILDRLQSYLYVEEKGERVYKGKDVCFIAAANFGYEYTDTRNVDGALMDRFIKFMIDYLPEEEEIKLLGERAPKAQPGDIKSLVKNANICRTTENLRVGVSTRQLIDMSHYLEAGFSFREIIDEIFINLFFNGTMDERELVKKMLEGTM